MEVQHHAKGIARTGGFLLYVLLVSSVAAEETSKPFTAELGGRVHWDFARFYNDARGTPNRNHSEWRRIWLDVSGKFYGLEYKVEGDFSSGKAEAKDMYLSKSFAAGRLTVGQFKQFYSLDDRTSSNYGTFLERGYLASTMAPLYRQGVAWFSGHEAYTWGVTAYSLESIDAWQVKGRALGGRATMAPRREQGDLLHLGVSLAHEAYDHPGANGAPALSVRPRMAGHLSDDSHPTLVSFANGRDVDVDKWALEYAQVRGPLSWQAELGGAEFDDGRQRASVVSGYSFVSWFATGESRRYDNKTGRFGRIKPLSKYGAVELALRYDEMHGKQHPDGMPDLRDGVVSAWTVGVNWYLRGNLRFMLNYIDSRYRDHLAGSTADRTRAITGRFHYDF
jgi:phosphate-selective porin OprO/OprP